MAGRCPVHGFVLVGDPPTVELRFGSSEKKFNPGGKPSYCKGCRDAGEGPHTGEPGED